MLPPRCREVIIGTLRNGLGVVLQEIIRGEKRLLSDFC